MAELRARHPSSPGEVPQSGQQQGYTGQTLPTCEEYVEKHQGNGDLNLGPFGPQVNINFLKTIYLYVSLIFKIRKLVQFNNFGGTINREL